MYGPPCTFPRTDPPYTYCMARVNFLVQVRSTAYIMYDPPPRHRPTAAADPCIPPSVLLARSTLDQKLVGALNRASVFGRVVKRASTYHGPRRHSAPRLRTPTHPTAATQHHVSARQHILPPPLSTTSPHALKYTQSAKNQHNQIGKSTMRKMVNVNTKNTPFNATRIGFAQDAARAHSFDFFSSPLPGPVPGNDERADA